MEPSEIKIVAPQVGDKPVWEIVEVFSRSQRQYVLGTASSLCMAECIAAALRVTAHLAVEAIGKATVTVEA